MDFHQWNLWNAAHSPQPNKPIPRGRRVQIPFVKQLAHLRHLAICAFVCMYTL